MAHFLRGTCLAQLQLHPRLWKIQISLEEAASFLPGQYMGFSTAEGNRLGFFSIASSPSDLPFITLYTRAPLNCSIGQALILSPPAGNMTLAPVSQLHYVLCAGGTGITPFLGVAKAFPQRSDWTLLWSIVEESDRAMLQDLPESTQKRLQVGLYPMDQDHSLFEAIRSTHLQLAREQAQYFLAGPMVFIEKVGNFLLAQGILPHQIVSDLKKF